MKAAKRGGSVDKVALDKYEKEVGKKAITSKNNLLIERDEKA